MLFWLFPIVFPNWASPFPDSLDNHSFFLTIYTVILIARLAEVKELKETNFIELYKDYVDDWNMVNFQILMAILYFRSGVYYVIFFIDFFINAFGKLRQSRNIQVGSKVYMAPELIEG